MAAAAGYVTNIAVFLVLMAVARMILPAGGAARVVPIVMAAALMCMMIAPIEGALSFIGAGGSANMLSGAQLRWDGAAMRKEAAYYEDAQKQAVLARYKIELEKALAALVEVDGAYTLESAAFELDETDEGFGRALGVALAVSKTPKAERRPLIRVEPPDIRVDLFGAPVNDVETDETASLKKDVATFYNVPVEHISIIVK